MTKKNIIKLLKIIIPIGFGIFLIWITYNKSTPQERLDIVRYIKNADYFWVFISIIFGFLSHLSRAYRWKYTLEPLGYRPKFLNSAMAVMIAYFANLGIPRSGEILRATTLTTYEGIPFEKGFGTIVAERIADLIVSFLIIFLALFFQYDMIIKVLKDLCHFILEKLNNNPILIYTVAGVFLTFIALFYKYLRRPNNTITLKIKTFITGFKDGILSIITMKKRNAFIAHTFFIWTMYVLMFYVIFLAIDKTKAISLGAVLTSFVTGSFTIATTNGGLGSYPYVISETLEVFNISNASGLAVGWIMWSAQTILTIILGAISFFYIPIYNRKK